MTTMLLQAIKSLPMAWMELVEAIQQGLLDNPLLDEVALAEDGFTPADSVADDRELYGVDRAEYFPDAGDLPGLPADDGGEPWPLEPPVRAPTTLSEHLLRQGLLAPAGAAEDPAAPLTDQQLVECLAAESVEIARRTVTKYRRELHLPPANRSKRTNEVQM